MAEERAKPISEDVHKQQKWGSYPPLTDKGYTHCIWNLYKIFKMYRIFKNSPTNNQHKVIGK